MRGGRSGTQDQGHYRNVETEDVTSESREAGAAGILTHRWQKHRVAQAFRKDQRHQAAGRSTGMFGAALFLTRAKCQVSSGHLMLPSLDKEKTSSKKTREDVAVLDATTRHLELRVHRTLGPQTAEYAFFQAHF